jgi:hypothetical protein
VNINRTKALVSATVFLLVFAIVYYIWANWGLVTIHAKNEPLSKVIASMERQGHANIQTDMSGDTPVTMDCVKVPLTDALETLSTVSDSRWRLLFFVAGDKATLKAGESSWFSGQQPDGWKMISFSMGGMGSNISALVADDSYDTPLDPREDVWTPKQAAPAPVQSYFVEAASLTNAGFAFPGDWNPSVDRMPPAGKITKSVPKLISYAGGREDQVFFLSQNGRRPTTADNSQNQGDDLRPDPDLIAERTQNEINRLPDDVRQEAQRNFDTQRAFWDSLKNMTDDERRQALQQHAQDPQVQDMIAAQQDSRDGRMNHDQRMQHYANYVNRKMAATGRP